MKKNNVKWLLHDSSHPIFNVWVALIDNGDYYYESFFKGEDPNQKSKSECSLRISDRIGKGR